MDGSIKKLYYSIGEVSEITGLDQHVLRYWETEFHELQPNKNRGGRRIYTEQDIALVRRIQQLLRDEKYTIEGARQVLSRNAADLAPEPLTRSDLLALRTFLQNLLNRL
ncbi:MAG TPA: MerR family transcriptional regulator [Rhodothermales bacterium]|nr:MerR family transcriptional regulator [Rhodothermales bacterium]